MESEAGRGSRFWFRLRLPAGLREAPQKLPRTMGPIAVERVKPMRILLAEDNIVNQTLVVRTLERQGHFVETAPTGLEALKRLDELPIDLVLMDVHMPEMDGLTATRILRQRELATGQHIPVIAMTANAMRGDREKCLEAGMDNYISKPLRLSELVEMVESMALKHPLEGGRPA